MDPFEHAQFLAAIAEATKHIRLAQAELRRARGVCHGELYEHIDLIFTRAYELQVRVDWMRQVALGKLPAKADPDSEHREQGPDRRRAVDRRVAGMRKQLLRLEGTS